MIFVGGKNVEQVYGGKSYILKTSETIVYEKEIYSACLLYTSPSPRD